MTEESTKVCGRTESSTAKGNSSTLKRILGKEAFGMKAKE
jgi:hypothetical protein